MILSEYLNDGTLIRHYSDQNVMLEQVETGDRYSDPIDVVPCPYTYIETDEPIDSDEEEDDEDGAYAEAGRILMGVTT